MRYIAFPKFPWVTFVEIEDEPANPEATGFLCAFAQMSAATHFMDLIHKAWRSVGIGLVGVDRGGMTP